MKAFSAALLAAAVCLLAANGAVEASRVGPARQLQQFNNGLGESCLGKIEAESFILSTINILLVDGLVLIPRYRLLSYVRRGNVFNALVGGVYLLSGFWVALAHHAYGF